MDKHWADLKEFHLVFSNLVFRFKGAFLMLTIFAGNLSESPLTNLEDLFA